MKRYSIIDGRPVENEFGVFVQADAAILGIYTRDETIERLKSQLASEQLRRERAEKVVSILESALADIVLGDNDPSVGLPGVKGLFHEAAPTWMEAGHSALESSKQYFAQYPKDSKDMKNG